MVVVVAVTVPYRLGSLGSLGKYALEVEVAPEIVAEVFMQKDVVGCRSRSRLAGAQFLDCTHAIIDMCTKAVQECLICITCGENLKRLGAVRALEKHGFPLLAFGQKLILNSRQRNVGVALLESFLHSGDEKLL